MNTDNQVTKAAILTVHGTWASARGANVAKWWEARSEFSAALVERLARRSIYVEIVEFGWSGANSDRDRTAAAIKLAEKVNRLNRSGFDQIHIVAHSHGGNVVEEAIARLNRFSFVNSIRGRNTPAQVRSVVSVGTPFFKTSIPLLRRIAIAGLLLAIPGIFIFAFAAIAAVRNPPFGPGAPAAETVYLSWVVMFLVPLFCLGSLVFFAHQVIDIIERYFPRHLVVPSWLAIHHTSDEAISLLKFAERQNIRFFEQKAVRLAFTRSIETISIIFFALSVISGAGILLFQLFSGGFTEEDRVLSVMPATIAAYVFPILWILAAIIGFFISPILALIGNNFLNKRLKSFAYGQDFQHSISDVQEQPHSLSSMSLVIDGVWGQKMLSSANAAIKQTVDQNHTALFRTDLGVTLDELEGRTTMESLFDGLIHTSYFAHVELVDVIASHVVESCCQSNSNSPLDRAFSARSFPSVQSPSVR